LSTLILTQRLAEAEQAYHQLITGDKPVEVRDSNGESIRYTMADKNKLKLYIEELKALIAGDNRNARRPFRPIWG
jgi:hypothetical protein